MFKSKLDRQVEKTQIKPARHPFVTLGAFVLLLFALGLGSSLLAALLNPVPVGNAASSFASPAPSTRAATSRHYGELPAGVKLVPTLGPAEARPEAWAVTIREGTLDGKALRWGEVSDPRVIGMVWTDFLEAYHWLYDTGWHPGYASEVDRYFTTGQSGQPDDVNLAEGIRQLLVKQQASAQYSQVQRPNYGANHEVFDFASDGLLAHVRVWEGAGHGQLWSMGNPPKLLEDHAFAASAAPTIYTLIYNRGDRRWKINEIEYLEGAR